MLSGHTIHSIMNCVRNYGATSIMVDVGSKIVNNFENSESIENCETVVDNTLTDHTNKDETDQIVSKRETEGTAKNDCNGNSLATVEINENNNTNLAKDTSSSNDVVESVCEIDSAFGTESKEREAVERSSTPISVSIPINEPCEPHKNCDISLDESLEKDGSEYEVMSEDLNESFSKEESEVEKDSVDAVDLPNSNNCNTNVSAAENKSEDNNQKEKESESNTKTEVDKKSSIDEVVFSDSEDLKLSDIDLDDDEDKDEQFLILTDDEECDSIAVHCKDISIDEADKCTPETKNKSTVAEIPKLSNENDDSDDEIDSLLPDFVKSEFAEIEKDDKKTDDVLSDCDAEMDSVIEAFKAQESDDDCLIIEDDNEDVIVLSEPDNTCDKVETKISLPEVNKLNSSPAKIVSEELNISIEDSNSKGSVLIENTEDKQSFTNVLKDQKDCGEVKLTSEKSRKSCSDLTNTKVEEKHDADIEDKCKESITVEENVQEKSDVIDLINQNLDSIVSLLSESNAEKTESKKTVEEEFDINNSSCENLDISKKEISVSDIVSVKDTKQESDSSELSKEISSGSVSDLTSDITSDIKVNSVTSESSFGINPVINSSLIESSSSIDDCPSTEAINQESIVIKSSSEIEADSEISEPIIKLTFSDTFDESVKELLNHLTMEISKAGKSKTSKGRNNRKVAEDLNSVEGIKCKKNIDSGAIPTRNKTEISTAVTNDVENSNDSIDLALELKIKDSLLESKGIESLGSPQASTPSEPKTSGSTGSAEFVEVVESVVTFVKKRLSVQVNSEQSCSDNQKESKSEEDSVSLPFEGDVPIETPEVSLTNRIEGLFSACNKLDLVNSKKEQIDEKVNSEKKDSHKVENEVANSDTKIPAKDDLVDPNDIKKKRRLDGESCNGNAVKKMKEDTSVADVKVISKFQSKLSWLDKIAQDLCVKAVTDNFADDIEETETAVQAMEERVEKADKDIEQFRFEANVFYSAQEKTFKDHNYNPKVPTRTVGVNVKIFRECDLQSLRISRPYPSTSFNSSQQSSPITTPTPPPKVTPPTTDNKSPSLPTQSKSVASSRPVSRPIQRPTSSPGMPSPNVAINANRPRAPVMSQRFASPNATVIRSGLPPTLNTQSEASRSSVTLPQKRGSDQMIDLTSDASNKKGSNVAPSAVSKVNLQSNVQTNNVLVPLSNVLQIFPSSQNASSNSQQVTRHLVPNIPSNMIGPRTLGYIVTPNTRTTNPSGVQGGITLPTLFNNQRQHLQTIFVRVTNPNTTAPLSSLVNSSPRMPSAAQASNTTTTASSNLKPMSKTSLHPAPFPVMPSYPPNSRMKSVPPKPTLKIQGTVNGLILSWNILVNAASFAEISYYQIFAYQETNGPVSATLWKPVGNVKALPLPMACTLTQFVEGHRYYFTIRAMDIHGRYGNFSDPVNLVYWKQPRI